MAFRKRTVHAVDLGAGYCEWIAREARHDVASAGFSHKFLGVLKRKQTRFEKGLGKTTKIFHYVFKPLWKGSR